MAGQTEYIRRSFEDDFQTQIEAGQSIAVEWEDTRFDSTAHKEWFRVESLGHSAEPANDASRVEAWTWQVTALARMGTEHSDEPTNRVWQLVDMVIEEYRWKEVTVVNWDAADPKPTFGILTFLQPETDKFPLKEEDLEGDQVMITLSAMFEKFS